MTYLGTIFLLFCFLISLFFYFKSSKKIITLYISIILGVLLCLFSLILVGEYLTPIMRDWEEKSPNDYMYQRDPEKVSVICPNLGKITGRIRYSGDKTYYYNVIQYLEKENGEVFLLNEYESGRGGDNSGIFKKYQGINSSLGFLPKNEFLRKKYDYVEPMNNKVVKRYSVDETSSYYQFYSDEQKNTDIATFIHPDKMTKNEFNTLIQCVKDNQENKFKTVENYKFEYNKPEYYLFNSRYFVYDNPTYYENRPYLANISCNNMNLVVAPSGIIKLLADKESLETVLVGSYHSNGVIEREKDFTKALSGFYGNKDKELFWIKYIAKHHYSTKKVNFDKAYKESQTLKHLFNEKGEPIDDYLRTCKNSQGKTIFDLFEGQKLG